MSYLIGVNARNGLRGDLHGMGLGYVGDLGGAAEKDALKIAKATATSQAAGELMARQIDYDKRAAALRSQLKAQNVVLTMTGKQLSSSQIEAEIVRRLGKRPSAPAVTFTGVVVPQPGIRPGATSPVFTGSGSGEGVDIQSSGPSPFLILGGLVAAGLLVTLVRRG